jgi:hypothetical protein
LSGLLSQFSLNRLRKFFSSIGKPTEKLDSPLIFLPEKSDLILKWVIARLVIGHIMSG